MTIQRPTNSALADGGLSQSWASQGDRWARIEPLSGREFFEAQAMFGDVSHKVTLRYFAGLTHTDRILFGSRTLHIVSLGNVEERGAEHSLICRETS